MGSENIPILIALGMIMAVGMVIVLWKWPEFLVAILLVGQDIIRNAFALFGMHLTRVQFAAAGSIVFGAVVVVLGLSRLMEARRTRTAAGSGHQWWILLLVLVIGVILAIGLAYTDAPWYGNKKFIEFLTFGVAPMVLCFVLIRDIKSAKRLLIWCCLISFGYVLLLSGYNLATHGTIFAQYREVAQEGETVGVASGDVLVRHLSVALAALLGLACCTKRGWLKRISPLVGIVFAAYIFGSGSRTGIVNLALFAVLIPLLLFRRYIGRALVVSVVLIAVATAVFFALPNEMTERIRTQEDLSNTEGSAGSRIKAWKDCVAMISSSPVIGHGTGSFAIVFFGRDVEAFPHNMMLEIFAENGVFGFAALCMLWFLLIKYPFQLWRRHRIGDVNFGLAVWCLLLLVGEVGSGMFHFGIAHAASTFLLTAGVVTRTITLMEQEDMAPARVEVRKSPELASPVLMR